MNRTPTIVFDLVDSDDEEKTIEYEGDSHTGASTDMTPPTSPTSPTSPVSPTKKFKFRFENEGENQEKNNEIINDENDKNAENYYNNVDHQVIDVDLPVVDYKSISPTPLKFGPSEREARRMRSIDTESDLEDKSFDEDGLWFKGHTPLPSESEEEEDTDQSQLDKLFNYDREFALPLVCEPFILNDKKNKLVHNECSFNEKDFSQHRKGSQPFQLAKQIIKKKHHSSSSSKHRKHHSSKRHKSKSEDKLDPFKKVTETVDGNVVIVSPKDESQELAASSTSIPQLPQQVTKDDDKVALRSNKKEYVTGRPKSFTISGFSSGSLPPLTEGAETSDKSGQKFDPERRLSLQDSLEVPTVQRHRKRRHGRQHHHKKHHHARHLQNKQVTLTESLEMRIKSGMQTLEEERKAIREIVTEIEGDYGQKEIEDITSHRFGHFQGSVRHLSKQPRRHMKSGMTTHMSDVESVCSVKPQRPHMHIDMEENQLKFIPRDPSHMSIAQVQDHEAGFVELEELTMNEFGGELQWKERARWIKFEEDVEKNERWGKPHVASLSFQGLLELRRGIEHGSVLLNLDNYDLPTIFESVVDNMIITDQVPANVRERIIGILLSKHCHHHQQNKGNLLQRKFSSTSISSFQRSDSVDTKDSGVDSSENGSPFTDAEKATEMTELFSSHRDVNGTGDHMEKNHHRHLVHQNEFDNGVVRSVDDYFDDNDDDGKRKKETAIRFAPVTEKPQGPSEFKTESDVKDRVPEGAEATSVLVATLNELERPAMAFIRLAKGCYLGNLTEVVIPVRFLFIIMGPPTNNDYYEIGRSVATLMSDKVFHDLAYEAKNRDDLLAAINSFLDDSIVLAPGDWDRHLLLPLLQAEITEKKRERIKLLKEKAHMDVPTDEQPFLRTGKAFGGLCRDVKKKWKWFASDFKDGFNWRCFVSIIFVFFATLAPTITFGALLHKKTGGNLGVIETLLATSLCGVLFSLTSGQPLIIVGTTGPILVFEQAVHDLCVHFDINFLVWRFWVGIMVMLILWLVVAFEGCFLVEYFTRFTEEVFSVLISFLFIYEAIYFLIKTLKTNPISHLDRKQPTITNTSVILNNNYSLVTNSSNNSSQQHNKQSYTNIPHTCDENDPNVFLISCLLVLGTYFIASYLRKLRFSHFLSGKSRRVLSDFGVPIAMCVMVGLNFLHDVEVPKIDMPHSFIPTKDSRKNFFVNPIEDIKPEWIAFGIIPAICVSILLFMETELTGVLLNKRKNKLKKGGGYNLDLFVMGGLTGLCSALGLPWMCAATVRSVQHQNALAIMSRSHAPGERPYLLHIKEQRMTNLCIHILMGIFTIFYDVIESIPLAVCLGVFMYLGITSLSGIQFIEQIKLIFVPSKYHPNRKYVRCVKLRSMISYTLIQVFCLICLVIIKLSPISPAFPFFIIGMVFLRRFIERYYEEEELEERSTRKNFDVKIQLDNEDDDEFDDFDEYGINLPM